MTGCFNELIATPIAERMLPWINKNPRSVSIRRSMCRSSQCPIGPDFVDEGFGRCGDLGGNGDRIFLDRLPGLATVVIA